MTDIEKIKSSVLRKIKPSRAEEEHARRFVSDLMRVAKTVSGLDCVIVGSIGKQTWLRGDHDIDLFMLFPKDVPRQELEKKGLEFGKRIIREMRGRHEIRYSEHPYVHGYVKGFVVDVVPCYRIGKGEKIISAVDRSPLHLEHIMSNLAAHDEARLLKQFCKGAGIYGSDVVMQGISGYICELLVLKYGSFEAALKAAASWEPGAVIALDNRQYDRKKFYNQPLVLIDPTDTGRNVAANLNPDNFVRFVLAARNFLKKPDESYFYYGHPKPLSARQLSLLKARGTSFVVLRMKRPDIIEDILFPQMRRALKRLETLLKQNDFVTIGAVMHIDKEMHLIFELACERLPNIKKMVGPPIFSKKHSEEFLDKYNDAEFGPYIEDIYWVVEKKRGFVTAPSLLKHFCRQKNLEAAGIPANVAKPVRSAKILDSAGLFKTIKKNKGLSSFLSKHYFEKLKS
ncbi:MAG: CCA tRNA nucleotidyltransferase [Candidatus Aenigmarchaeota archaeon]|nr:CCA tRNA nucleotidyltransferase [Candidatus Aenigmarchaeota archaeon]